MSKNFSTLLKQFDTEDMYSKIIHLPEQILKSYEANNIHEPKEYNKKGINRIIICGMGGSAISGDLAKVTFQHLLPIEVVKDYTLPYLDEKTLVIALSYSGNTEETLSCFKHAMKKTKNLAAVTSGGKLKEIVNKKYPWIELIPGYPPRSAIGFLFFSLIKLLEKFEIIESQKDVVKKTVANLIKKAGAVAINVSDDVNLAKITAWTLFGRIPIIYSSNPELAPLAYRWKCQINENAKYPAFFHTFSEMNHNEIEGWEAKGMENKFIPIILRRMIEDVQTEKRLNAFKSILNKIGSEFHEFPTEGDTLIEEIFSMIYFGDIISYYLALLNEVNPTGIEFIDFLKNQIS